MRFAAPLAALTVTVVMAGCGTNEATTTTPSDGATGTTAPAASASPTPSSSPAAASSSPASATPAADVVLPIQVKGGKVTPTGDRVRVKRGQTVLIEFSSDAVESIHVHGYDKEVKAKPGKTAQLSFVADQSGVFEIETHETEKLVAKLIVA